MYKPVSLITTFLLLAQPAIADTFYFGGNIGVSMIDDTVDAAPTSVSGPGVFPDQISLNGQPFDSNETAWGAFVGWNAYDWLAIELGYTDLGNAGQDLPFGFFEQTPLTISQVVPISFIPAAFIIAAPAPSASSAPALSIEEWSIAAKFSKTLISSLSANWSVGITRAHFDVEGQLTVSELVTLVPLEFRQTSLPYAAPDSETGFNLGFGFAWGFNDRFSADIGYQKHDTRVIDVETVALRLIVTL